jgi:hypothetical protein
MGLRYRTPISTLRDQRLRAEQQHVPQQKVTASQLRVRALDSLHNSANDGKSKDKDRQKSRELLERLRLALQDDTSHNDTSTEYHSLQDEIARVKLRQMAGQEPGAAPQEIQMDTYRASTQPFLLVLVPEAADSFPKRIRRLDSPLANFDCYMPAIQAADSPSRPLSLAPEAVEAECPAKDHSDHAADLVQDTMTRPTSKDMQIPTSLALSLLND